MDIFSQTGRLSSYFRPHFFHSVELFILMKSLNWNLYEDPRGKNSLLITSTDAERTFDKIQHPFINAEQIEYRWNIPKYKKDKCIAKKYSMMKD